MAKKLTLTIPNGTTNIVLNTDMYLDSWKQVECYHKNLAPAESYINITIPYDSNIANNLITHSDEDIKAVISDGNTIIYTGYLRKTYKLSKTQNNKPIALELRSPSFFLEKELGRNVCLQSKTVLYVMNYLFKAIGFYSTDKTAADIATTAEIQTALNQALDVVVLEETNKVNEILKTLSFEIGTVYNFNNKGEFRLFPLFNEEPVTHIFSEENMYKSVEVTKKEQEADSITLNWTEKKLVEDAVIFADTQGGDSDTTCKIEIPAGEYLYGQETNKCEYDNEEGKVIWALSATPEITGITGYEATNQGTYLELKYKNNSTEIQTITKMVIKGSAWVEVEGGNSTRSTSGSKTKEFNIKYLNSNSKIKTLAEKLAKYYKYQDFSVHVYSHDNISVGSFASVSAEGIGTITAKVIQKTTYATKACYEYVLEASKEYDVIVVETKKNKESSPYYNMQAQINEIAQMIDGVESNTTLMLFKRAAQKPSSAGIVGKGTYNFETGILTWNTGTDSKGWKQIQNLDDGTDPIWFIAAYVSGKGTASIADNQWSEPKLYIKNGENGENATSTYSIIPNFNVVTRYKDGSLSSDDIVFNFYQGNESSRGEVSLFYIISKRNSNGLWEEVTRGTGSSASYTITNENGIHCDVYRTSADDVPLDSETVMIVNEGQDAISVVLSNPSAFIAVGSDGNVVDYENTASNLFVLCGADFLNYGDADTPGNFDFDILYTNCSAEGAGDPEYTGYIVDETSTAYIDENGDKYQTVGSFILPKLTSMTAEFASRSITVRGTSYNGSPFSYTIIQNFKKIHYGLDGSSVEIQSVEYAVSDSTETLPTEWSETMPSVVNQGQYLWTKKIYINDTTGEGTAEYTYQYKALDGSDGEPGADGQDGLSSVFHVAYANSADGTVDFSLSDSANKKYIGQYVDFNSTSSTNPAKYKWSEIKGEKGDNGTDGTGGFGILLYKRSESQPALPTAELTFKLANPPVLTWGESGSSKGWEYNKPAVTSDKLPLWQISAAATFSGDTHTDKIQPSEWHLDGIVQLDNGLTEEETQNKIDASISTYDKNLPVFTYSVDKYTFTTDAAYIAQQTQNMVVTLDCTRNGSSVNFEIINVEVPDSLTFTYFENNVYLTAKAGVEIHDDKIKVKVKLSSPKVENYITDENGNNYYDENNAPFGDIEYYTDAIAKQTVEIPFRVMRGERNLGEVRTENKLPVNPLIGDFIIWMGDSIESKKSATGTFTIATLYYFDGEMWKIDNDSSHISRSLDSILSVAEEDFEKNDESLYANNSWAYSWLDHLTANSIFAKKLVANDAFIDRLTGNEGFIKKLMSNEITVGYTDEYGNTHDGSIQSLNFDEESGTGYRIDSEGNAEFNGGKFKGKIVADELEIGSDVKNISQNYIIEPGDIDFDQYNKIGVWYVNSDMNAWGGTYKWKNAPSLPSAYISPNGLPWGGFSVLVQQIGSDYLQQTFNIYNYQRTFIRRQVYHGGSVVWQSWFEQANTSDIPGGYDGVTAYSKIFYRIKDTGNAFSYPTPPSSYIKSDTSGWTLSRPAAKVGSDDYIIFSCTQYMTTGTSGCQHTSVTIDGDTVIDTSNGFIKINLLDVDTLFSKTIKLKNNGSIQSSNYDGTKKTGFCLTADGVVDIYNLIGDDIACNSISVMDTANFNRKTTMSAPIATKGFNFGGSGLSQISNKNMTEFLSILSDHFKTIFNTEKRRCICSANLFITITFKSTTSIKYYFNINVNCIEISDSYYTISNFTLFGEYGLSNSDGAISGLVYGFIEYKNNNIKFIQILPNGTQSTVFQNSSENIDISISGYFFS